MKGFYGILLGSILLTAACDDDEPTGPSLDASATTDQSRYTFADTIVVTLTNTSDDEALIVHVCEYGQMPVVRVDQRANGQWEPYSGSGCLGPSIVGRLLEPGEFLVNEIPANAFVDEPGTYRIGFYANGLVENPTQDDVVMAFTGSITVE